MDNFFNGIYKNANESYSNIPWATLDGNIYLKEYLENEKQTTNKKALVIGCGLGDDANLLFLHGYIVDAIDISQNAINLAKKRFPNTDINFMVQDIFNLPDFMKNNYDFIYEGLTIQSINPKFREEIIKTISNLNNTNGKLLVYTNIQNDNTSLGGPPWPLYKSELELFNVNRYETISSKYLEESKQISPLKNISLFNKM